MPDASRLPMVRSMNFDRRSEARERVTLPVSLPGGEAALTRDVSASGLSFEFGGRLEAGSTIALSVALSDVNPPLRLQAQGLVVRVERRGRRSGVGVRILSSMLETVSRDARLKFIH